MEGLGILDFLGRISVLRLLLGFWGFGVLGYGLQWGRLFLNLLFRP